jgi:hypothetical protein
MDDHQIQQTLLIELHGAIENAAQEAVAKLGRGDPYLSPEMATQQAVGGVPDAADEALASFCDPAALRASVALMKASLVSYPPTEGATTLSQAEHEALATMSLTPEARSALQKLVSDAAASTLFRFFCLVDAVGHPEVVAVDEWLGAHVGKKGTEEHYPMLHDEFLEAYWDYRRLTASR